MSREQIVNTAPKKSQTLFDAGNGRADETTVSQRRERVQTALTGDFGGGNRFGGETAGLSPMTAQAPPSGGVAQMSKGGKGRNKKNIQADYQEINNINKSIKTRDDEINQVSKRMGLVMSARTDSITKKGNQVPEVQDLMRQVQGMDAERAQYCKIMQDTTIPASEKQEAIAKNAEIVEKRDAIKNRMAQLRSMHGTKDNPELAALNQQQSVLQTELERLKELSRNQALSSGSYETSILTAESQEDMLSRYHAMRSGMMSLHPDKLSDAEIAENYLSLRKKSALLNEHATAVHTSNSTGDSSVANEALKPYAKKISLADAAHGGGMNYGLILDSILTKRGDMIAKTGSSVGWQRGMNDDDLTAMQEMMVNGYGDFEL